MIVKRFVKLVVLAMMSLVVACGDGSDGASSSGGSTPQPVGYTVDESGTWLIASEAGLRAFADLVNDSTSQAMRKTNAKLVDNITLSDGWNPIGYSNGSSLTKAYEGTFDGDNHSITGLVIQGNEDFKALFGYTFNATIKNFTVIGPLVSGSYHVSAVVAYNSGGNIENVHVKNGRLTGKGYETSYFVPKDIYYSYVGGIAGVNDGGTIKSCSSESILSGKPYVNTGIISAVNWSGGIVIN